MVTDQSGNVVWQWDNTDPFGNSIPNQSPNGTGTQFVFNLRFPGMYNDVETGTFYNYFRDYNPAIGGYLQSDPLGLYGGQFSTYAYVGGDPLGLFDFFGLGACVVTFPDYPIDTGFGFTSTSLGGHGGEFSYNADGDTSYYEYGRYSPADPNVVGAKLPQDDGNVRHVPMPDVDIDPKTGLPTQKSLDAISKYLSKRLGHDTKVDLACTKDSNSKKVSKYAEDFAKNANRPKYSWKPWSSNQCRDFANRAVEAGK